MDAGSHLRDMPERQQKKHNFIWFVTLQKCNFILRRISDIRQLKHDISIENKPLTKS